MSDIEICCGRSPSSYGSYMEKYYQSRPYTPDSSISNLTPNRSVSIAQTNPWEGEKSPFTWEWSDSEEDSGSDQEELQTEREFLDGDRESDQEEFQSDGESPEMNQLKERFYQQYYLHQRASYQRSHQDYRSDQISDQEELQTEREFLEDDQEDLVSDQAYTIDPSIEPIPEWCQEQDLEFVSEESILDSPFSNQYLRQDLHISLSTPTWRGESGDITHPIPGKYYYRSPIILLMGTSDSKKESILHDLQQRNHSKQQYSRSDSERINFQVLPVSGFLDKPIEDCAHSETPKSAHLETPNHTNSDNLAELLSISKQIDSLIILDKPIPKAESQSVPSTFQSEVNLSAFSDQACDLVIFVVGLENSFSDTLIEQIKLIHQGDLPICLLLTYSRNSLTPEKIQNHFQIIQQLQDASGVKIVLAEKFSPNKRHIPTILYPIDGGSSNIVSEPIDNLLATLGKSIHKRLFRALLTEHQEPDVTILDYDPDTERYLALLGQGIIEVGKEYRDCQIDTMIDLSRPPVAYQDFADRNWVDMQINWISSINDPETLISEYSGSDLLWISGEVLQQGYNIAEPA